MRLNWITAAAILASATATASIEQEILICAKSTDKLDRLICYDTLEKKIKTTDLTRLTATSVASSTTAVTQPSHVALSVNIEDEFGQPALSFLAPDGYAWIAVDDAK